MKQSNDIESLVAKAEERNKRSVAKLVDLFESSLESAIPERAAVMSSLRHRQQATIIGITGTPGAGKSTLTGVLAESIVRLQPQTSVAVLAVDPASHISGGALLGDRTRISFPVGESRLYFRSQSSDLMLGGLAPNSFDVVRLLERLFDYVFVETVGIGQSEISIRYLADKTYLVLQPFAGDQIQFMKAGIMEIPDAFILNKCDEEKAAQQSYYALRTSLKFARPDQGDHLDIFRCSARTGKGVPEIVADIMSAGLKSAPESGRNQHFFEQWVADEFGNLGVSFLHKHFFKDYDSSQLIARYDATQEKFRLNFLSHVRQLS